MVWAEKCDSVEQCNYTECEVQELLIHETIGFYFNTLHGYLIHKQYLFERDV